MAEYYILQNGADPSIYYRERRGQRHPNGKTAIVLTEVRQAAEATKFTSVASINKSLEKVFLNKIKGHLVDMSGGFKIIRCEQTISFSETKVDGKTNSLLKDLQKTSKLVNNTHYSTIELFNKIRSDESLADYKYILSTVYDRMNTSKLSQTFEGHGLEPIKHKGNFAFNKEEYWTAAKLLCDVPYKSFNLTE